MGEARRSASVSATPSGTPSGIVIAKSTPATVAWMPEWTTDIHSATPTIRYGHRRVTPKRFSATRTAKHAAAAPSAGSDSSPA